MLNLSVHFMFIYLYIAFMIYLLASVILFALNNVLWAKYASQVNQLHLIRNRAVYTVLLMGIITLGVWLFSSFIQFHIIPILELCGVGLIGFLGLYFLVLGFRQGTLTQFLVYNLLFVLGVAMVSHLNKSLDLVNKMPAISIIAIGFLLFIYFQFYNKGKIKSAVSHLYFFVAHICFGFLLFLQAYYLERLPQLVVAFSQEIVVLLLASAIIFIAPKGEYKGRALSKSQYFFFAIPISLAVLFGLEGLYETHPFYSALINLLTPVVSVGIGYFFKVERFKWQSLIGIGVMLFGLVVFYFDR